MAESILDIYCVDKDVISPEQRHRSWLLWDNVLHKRTDLRCNMDIYKTMNEFCKHLEEIKYIKSKDMRKRIYGKRTTIFNLVYQYVQRIAYPITTQNADYLMQLVIFKASSHELNNIKGFGPSCMDFIHQLRKWAGVSSQASPAGQGVSRFDEKYWNIGTRMNNQETNFLLKKAIEKSCSVQDLVYNIISHHYNQEWPIDDDVNYDRIRDRYNTELFGKLFCDLINEETFEEET